MIIDDSTSNDILFDKNFARGAEPRDFNTDPPAMFSPPSEAELIPESEWDARIDEQEEKQTSLEHLWRRYWKDSVQDAHLDQNGQGFCWAYSTAHSIMMALVRDNQPCPRLSAHAVACKIKGFQDQGGWCGQSAEFARKYGYPTVATWKEKSMSRQYDTEETWNEAKTYQIKEDYVDLAPSHWYYQNLTRNQLATMLLRNLPCPTDWNFWGHSVCAVRWVRIERGVYGPRILNSWAGWGKQGFADIIRQNGTPNSAVCTRYVSAI